MAEPPLARYSDPLAPLSPYSDEYPGPVTIWSWCDDCGEQTPTGRCPECDRPMCANCERCNDCIYADDYWEDEL